jgi:hypothetical protein
VFGFYCALHGYQKPRQNTDSTLAISEPVFEQHLRRRTSFVAPESMIAAEMSKSPGLIRDRPGAPRSAGGPAILEWLMQRRSLTEQAAMATASRMLALEILQPVPPTPENVFKADKSAVYRVVLMTAQKHNNNLSACG